MEIRKLAKSTPTALWIGWDPVPGCEGYLFYVGGVRVSKSFQPSKKEAKFHPSAEQKGIRVEAIVFTAIDSGGFPSATPEPPTTVIVAPRVAYKDIGSDARYCLWLDVEGGTLRPGLVYVTVNGEQCVRDQVAIYGKDGLCKGSERSDGRKEDGIVSARELDGRPLCSLPMPGDPAKNTGSWIV